MFEFLKKLISEPPAQEPPAQEPPGDSPWSGCLQGNLKQLKELFQDVEILRVRELQGPGSRGLSCFIAYFDGLVNTLLISENVVRPLLEARLPLSCTDPLDFVEKQVVQVGEVKRAEDLSALIDAVTYGETILFVEGGAGALILDTKSFQTRSISEPDNERNLYGPREGFTEPLMQNLSLLRRRARTQELKMQFLSLGQRTKTKICICYMEGLAKEEILKELYARLDKIDIDGILDSNYVAELIKDNPWTPFRTVGFTERPDVVIAKLLEGRVALLVDGSPLALTLPYLFIENFQSSEDYYGNFFYASFVRAIRIIGFFLTVLVPGLYISIVAFHHEMIPLPLFISVAAEQQSVPLPAALEALILILVFDILKEAGARMPSNIGQALSIVGALVIGQAAVEAKLVAAPMIIVIALTGITGLLVPTLNAPIIYLRLVLLGLSAMFGFFGLFLGFSGVLIYLINLRSFGVPELIQSRKLSVRDMQDSFVRLPWWEMLKRPAFARDSVRQESGERKI